MRVFGNYAAQVALIFLAPLFPFIPLSCLCFVTAQNDKNLNLAFLHRNGSPFIL